MSTSSSQLEAQIVRCPHDIFCVKPHQFSTINLQSGRDGGDYVLGEIEKRLTRIFGGQGKVMRLSGTEFVGIRYGNHSRNDTQAFANHLVAQLERPIYWPGNGQILTPNVLLGISTGHSAGEHLKTGIQNAALALFAAKNSGQSCVFYSDQIRQQIESLLESERLVQDALCMDRVRYLVQPKVNSEEIVVGGEVLMRLRDDDDSLISPDRFIDIAERRGHIVALGESLLLSSAEFLSRLPAPIHLAVNVSPVQLQYNGFVNHLEHILRITDIDPGRLELEITESAALGTRRILNTLNAVKSLGVRLALDDFGTQYSSLSHLRSIPADVLKIDRAFIADIDSDSGRRLLFGIVQIAKALDMQVVAEGVETPAQADILRQMGCDYMQGYVFYKPMMPEAFQTLVQPNNVPLIDIERQRRTQWPTSAHSAQRNSRMLCGP